MDWIKAHKTQIGVVFGAISAALATLPDPHHYISWGISLISSFLIGAGVLPSDQHAQAQQDSTKV